MDGHVHNRLQEGVVEVRLDNRQVDAQGRASLRTGSGKAAFSYKRRIPRGFHVKRLPWARPGRLIWQRSPLPKGVGPMRSDPGVDIRPKHEQGGRRNEPHNHFKPEIRNLDAGWNKKNDRQVAAHPATAAPNSRGGEGLQVETGESNDCSSSQGDI
ncbi:unnamed protein product [Linum trigynum]|uniref:Uncharacterized protein n=1 Tax=Linum trigynum TaxID=586398 RepID=A0AAV2E881_9ROSI